MVGDTKLARKGAFDQKENRELVPKPKQEEMDTRHHIESSYALTGQWTNM